jgi:hypothetical protein
MDGNTGTDDVQTLVRGNAGILQYWHPVGVSLSRRLQSPVDLKLNSNKVDVHMNINCAVNNPCCDWKHTSYQFFSHCNHRF